MTTIAVIDDHATRAELEEALTNVARDAMRQPHVNGSAEHPSAWERRHAMIDGLLDRWERA